MLKKVLFFTFLTLLGNQFSEAMMGPLDDSRESLVVMPDRQKLQSLLREQDLGDVIESTHILVFWADRTLATDSIEYTKLLVLYQLFGARQDQQELCVRTETLLNNVIDEIVRDNQKAKKRFQFFRDRQKNFSSYLTSKIRLFLAKNIAN